MIDSNPPSPSPQSDRASTALAAASIAFVTAVMTAIVALTVHERDSAAVRMLREEVAELRQEQSELSRKNGETWVRIQSVVQDQIRTESKLDLYRQQIGRPVGQEPH